jgi:hypothetical protein
VNQIGRYQIVRELGRGAMGVVFEARDPLIGRTVALKMIRLDALGTPDEREWLQERLFREARSAGALSHPGIVVIYDLGTSEGLAYIAMEYVDGPTMEKVLAAAEPLNWDEALSILRQTANALDHAHGAGVVHRDVKPANIMLQRSKTVKITDFGIAKITSTQQITRTGMTMGTPSYMSPEQITAKAVDGRADQFSLAVVAYQILTGVKPFQGESLPNLVYQIVYEDRPSARSVKGTLPEAVDDVLRRGLAKLPEDRYGSCSGFVNALEAALAGSPKPDLEPASVRERQESEFTAMFGEYIETRRQQEHAAKLASLVEQIEGLLASDDVRAAAPLLDLAREEFGEEPALLQLAGRLEETKQRQVEGAVNRAREWLETRNFAAALNVLDIAGAENIGAAAAPIVELRAQVVEEQAAAEARRAYEAELEKTLAHAKSLLSQNAPAEAAALLESANERYGQEGEFTQLFADAITARKSAEARAAKLEACVSIVKKFLRAGAWQAAQTALADAQRDFVDEPALVALQSRIEEVRQAEKPRESPTPAVVASVTPEQTHYSAPAVVPKRPAIPKGLLVGASAAAAVVAGLLLVKLASTPHAPAPQPAKLEAKPEVPASGPLRIAQFYSSPPNPVKGQKVLVCYGVENASEVRIDPPIERVWPSPSRCLEVKAARTVTYTLTATSGAENVSKSITVQIGPPPVKIVELSVNQLKITPGETITLCYKVTNATKVLLGPGTPSGPHTNETGCVTDHPQRTTTYTLTARGAGGSVDTERATVTVAAPAKTDPEPAKPKEGRIIWSGTLPPGGDLTIDGGTASIGVITGTLPGVPVTVEVHPDSLTLTTTPDAGNSWKRLTIHNAPNGTAQAIISIKWTARQ